MQPQPVEKEKKGVNQAKHNVPINPEDADIEELLEKQMDPLKLEDRDKDFLRTSLKTGKFSKGAKIIAKKLREKGKYERANKLEDMGPLFDPHDFWNN